MHRPPRGKVGCRRVHAISQIVQSCLLVSGNRGLHSKGPGARAGWRWKGHARPRKIRYGRDVREAPPRKERSSPNPRALSNPPETFHRLFVGAERRVLHARFTVSRFNRNHIEDAFYRIDPGDAIQADVTTGKVQFFVHRETEYLDIHKNASVSLF